MRSLTQGHGCRHVRGCGARCRRRVSGRSTPHLDLGTPPAADVPLTNLTTANRPFDGRPHELQRRHHQVRGAVASGGLQHQHDLPGSVAPHPFVGQRRARDVTAELLQRLAVFSAAAHDGVQAEPVHVRAQRIGSSSNHGGHVVRLPVVMVRRAPTASAAPRRGPEVSARPRRPSP
jgi:hypothetical protein